MKDHPVTFLLVCAVAGAVVFGIAGRIFQTNYDAIERKIAEASGKKQPPPDSPSGATPYPPSSEMEPMVTVVTTSMPLAAPSISFRSQRQSRPPLRTYASSRRNSSPRRIRDICIN